MGTPDLSSFENQTFTGPDGKDYTVKGGRLLDPQGNQYEIPANSSGQVATTAPSFANDVAATTGPSLYKGLVDVGTAPVSMADLLMQGAGAAGSSIAKHIPGTTQEQADKWSGEIEKNAAAKREELKPYLPSSLLAQEQPYMPSLGNQAQTMPGRFWQTGMEMAPAIPLTAAMMGSGLLPAAARTAGSAIGSQGVGEFTDNPWARMAGALAGFGMTPTRGIPPATDRGGMVARAQAGNVPVSAAEISNSPWKAALEGGPPDRTAATTQSLLKQSGIPKNTNPLSENVYQRGQDLGQVGNQLGAQTSIPATPQLRQQLVATAVPHAQQFGGSSLEKPEVQQAIDDYDHFTMGGFPLSGTQYQALHQQWSASPVPELRAMSKQLDTAMDAAHPGVWDKWRTDYANQQGVKAASDAAGGAGTTVGIDAGTVNRNMYKPTDMKKFAEAVEGLDASYPKASDVSKITRPALAAAGGIVGHHFGEPYTELGVLGPGLGYTDFLTPLIQKMARSKIGQGALNMSPQAAATALLASQPAVTGQNDPSASK